MSLESADKVTSLSQVAATILTGFLRAGKTSLLNHFLSGDHGMRIAVLVNYFGAVNIDEAVVEAAINRRLNQFCTSKRKEMDVLKNSADNSQTTRDRRTQHGLDRTHADQAQRHA